MKHAGKEALERLEAFLAELRQRDKLQEKRLGIFYLKSRAFLHFHEDPKGMFADIRLGTEFSRYPINTTTQRNRLIDKVDRHLANQSPRRSIRRSTRHRARDADS